jgi:HemY protein
VLFVVPPYRVEVSLNLVIVGVLGGFVAVYVLARLVAHALSLPAQVRMFRERRARDKARSRMLDGLKGFFESRYAKSERAAAEALALGEEPAINATIAARAAHELRRFADRDRYLAQAADTAPEEITLRLMTQAELLADERRFPEALQALRTLHEQSSRAHTGALRLELRVHQQLGNWDQVLKLVDQLDQRHAFDAVLVRRLKRRAQVENLMARATQGKELEDYWLKMSSDQRADPEIAAAAARAFTGAGRCTRAHELIEQALETEWNPELVALYGEGLGDDSLGQIERAEKWLNTHHDDAMLLLTLGKLCAHQQLWGKAQSYLEASVSIAPSREAHVELARLAERLDRPEEARRHYRESLETSQ